MAQTNRSQTREGHIATVGARNLWRQMGQTSQVNAYGVLLSKCRRTVGVAAVRANARMKL